MSSEHVVEENAISKRNTVMISSPAVRSIVVLAIRRTCARRTASASATKSVGVLILLDFAKYCSWRVLEYGRKSSKRNCRPEHDFAPCFPRRSRNRRVWFCLRFDRRDALNRSHDASDKRKRFSSGPPCPAYVSYRD